MNSDKRSELIDYKSGNEHILIVDDDELVLKMLSDMLFSLGYNVKACQNTTEAKEYFEEHHALIDMVVFDLEMPGDSGDELYEAFKSTKPLIKALLVTAHSNDERITKVISDGCNYFLQKPFNIERLSHAMREVLEL